MGSSDQPRLTKAQQRILDEVRRDGLRVYGGRSDRPITALDRLGLVSARWELSFAGLRIEVRPPACGWPARQAEDGKAADDE